MIFVVVFGGRIGDHQNLFNNLSVCLSHHLVHPLSVPCQAASLSACRLRRHYLILFWERMSGGGRHGWHGQNVQKHPPFYQHPTGGRKGQATVIITGTVWEQGDEISACEKACWGILMWCNELGGQRRHRCPGIPGEPLSGEEDGQSQANSWRTKWKTAHWF